MWTNKFNSWKQEPAESIDDFIIDLYALAEHTEYGVLHKEMICDRLVFEVIDGPLAEKF